MNYLGNTIGLNDFVARSYIDGLTLTAYKPSDETVTSSTTLQDDDDLHFSTMPINVNYAIDGILFVTGNTSGDLKLNVNLPTGATTKILFVGVVTSATALNLSDPSFAAFDASADFTLGTVTGSTAAYPLRGFLSMSTSTGTFGLRWAQNTSNGTATSLLKGSWMRLRKL